MTKEYQDWPDHTLEPAWATIGNFDGVHLGHQALINRVINRAKNDGVQSLVVTFWPHPRVFFTKTVEGYYLNNQKEKRDLLAASGVDTVLCLPFDQSLADMNTKEFIAKLNSIVPLKGLIVGESFALGKGRSGTGEVLQKVCDDFGIKCVHISPELFDGQVISSQRIRQALDSGDVKLVASLLGRSFTLSGYVAPGRQEGTKLGFPTANLYFDSHRKLPRFGVYACLVDLDGKFYKGVTNVGIRPTFDDGLSPSIETLLLDFDDNIYYKLIHVHFIEHIRDEVKFKSIADLVEQINIDKTNARRILTDGT